MPRVLQKKWRKEGQAPKKLHLLPNWGLGPVLLPMPVSHFLPDSTFEVTFKEKGIFWLQLHLPLVELQGLGVAGYSAPVPFVLLSCHMAELPPFSLALGKHHSTYRNLGTPTHEWAHCVNHAKQIWVPNGYLLLQDTILSNCRRENQWVWKNVQGIYRIEFTSFGFSLICERSEERCGGWELKDFSRAWQDKEMLGSGREAGWGNRMRV